MISKAYDDNAKLSSKDGLLALLDVVVQIAFGAVSRKALAAKTSFTYLQLALKSIGLDWFIFVLGV